MTCGSAQSSVSYPRSPICEMFGIEFPLIAFTHCRDVVVAVSKAGGMGVFGAVAHPPDRLEEELCRTDESPDVRRGRSPRVQRRFF